MSLVTVQNLTVSFSGTTIFDKVSFQLAAGDRVGLVGPNGSGKTTLMRLLAGEGSAEKGEMLFARNVTVGYLPQDVQEAGAGRLLPSIIDAVPGRVALREDLAKAEDDLHHAHEEDEQIRLAVRVAELHDAQNRLDMRHPPHEAERILTGLGFRPSDYEAPLGTLSGGWKMRGALARLLYLKPDMLLMDEPTNHLDIPSVHWFETFLQTFPGALVLVCHDRDFLNRQVKRLFSFEPEGFRSYSGNYDSYVVQRAEEERVLENQAKNQDNKVREAKRFIERFKAKASKARQAQSRAKILEKMEMIETHQTRQTIRFSFPPTQPSGRSVVYVDKVAKAFGEKKLYEDLSLHVQRGEKVAIIGPNGAGKTTLLKIVAGELAADAGTIRLGTNVEMAYYAQHQSDTLIAGNSVAEEVWRAVPGQSMTYVRTVCGSFLFSGDAVDKPVRVLSGGEKARVALARCLVAKANLLLMDEPTNHLDLSSTEVLIDALERYDGTLIFVSHNQSFVNRLATRIWDMRDGEVVEYPGGLYEYYDFVERREKAAAQAAAQAAAPVKAPPVKAAPAPVLAKSQAPSSAAAAAADAQSRKDKRREEADRRRAQARVLDPIRKKIAPLEERIGVLEAREKELQDLLADPEVFGDKARGVPLLTEYGDVRSKLEELMGRWERLQEELEEARATVPD